MKIWLRYPSRNSRYRYRRKPGASGSKEAMQQHVSRAREMQEVAKGPRNVLLADHCQPKHVVESTKKKQTNALLNYWTQLDSNRLSTMWETLSLWQHRWALHLLELLMPSSFCWTSSSRTMEFTAAYFAIFVWQESDNSNAPKNADFGTVTVTSSAEA